MADAAGVRLGQVSRVSDLSYGASPFSGGYSFAASPGAIQNQTQIPVGELEVQVTVEVDFAFA